MCNSAKILKKIEYELVVDESKDEFELDSSSSIISAYFDMRYYISN